MHALYLTDSIRKLEQQHAAEPLMERAGHAVATLARSLLAEGHHRILVVAGPGNNGGDAFVAARYLKAWWHEVTVVFVGQRASLPPDAAHAYDGWLQCGGEVVDQWPQAASDWQLVIDGLFGIGLQRPLTGAMADMVARINSLAVPVLAIDIPSGLAADTGVVLGTAVRATHTITFLGRKPGLYTLDGPDHAGKVHVDLLGLPPEQPADGTLLDAPPALPSPRRLNSHKGSNGSAGVIGGAASMTGAALLTARAALLLGAGRVYATLLDPAAPALDAQYPELMLREPDQLPDVQALAVGPGMGRSPQAHAALQQALANPAPLVLDADALNLLAGDKDMQQALAKRAAGSAVMTPHPGEAATLLATDTAALQADRIAAACTLAQRYQAIVLLKGCGTVVATPEGRWWINASGNPGLGSAGMGDTLTGIIVALAAQGMPLLDATLLAAYLHGAAADAAVAHGQGPVGLTATEVMLSARRLLNRWIEAAHA
ncbi:MAG TPA: NAD(P)H-hydrate dehydratase [Methylovorus sp.]|nr:NAD(P)H-hydrate dehydratase [Methylovorus sp.]